ncbi:MAG: TIGR03905 family TSCPD domain-containing protein [Clostridia bacterium]|nr:TIGR03905 family TSCPD domain-containing protein [Clostridia bacterium]MBR3152184.1 TIGR03905 family TSCPD domain-containing protein [Clostridia bacterium]MBR3152279.1 TIGR03905 family TSCPD domain-containing protein [Clostridia bacterium]
MEFSYQPKGVCSYNMKFVVDGDIIKEVVIEGGCMGNTAGISKLLIGMKVEDAIKRLKGIDCRGRGTSCPDQIAKALEKYMEG